MPFKTDQIVQLTAIKIDIEKNIHALNNIVQRAEHIEDLTHIELIELNVIIKTINQLKIYLKTLIN